MREAIASASASRRLARDDGAHKADAQRFFGVDRLAGEDHLERLPAADEARQSLGTAREGQKAHRDLGHRERRAFGRDTDVAGERELEARARGVAVDSADDRLREVREAAEGIGWRSRGCGGPRPGPSSRRGAASQSQPREKTSPSAVRSTARDVVCDGLACVAKLAHDGGVDRILAVGTARVRRAIGPRSSREDVVAAHWRSKL